MGNKLPHAKGDVFQGKNIYMMFSYKKKEESKLKLSISTFKTNVFEIVTTIPQTQDKQEYVVVVMKIPITANRPGNSFKVLVEYEGVTYTSQSINEKETLNKNDPNVNSMISYDKKRNNYLYGFTFKPTNANVNLLHPPSYLMFKKSEEFKLFMKFLSGNAKEFENVITDSIKEVNRNCAPPQSSIELLFVLDILAEAYRTTIFVSNLFDAFNLNIQIEKPWINISPYVQLIKTAFSRCCFDNNFMKFIVYFFHIYPEHWNVFFTACDNEQSSRKGIASSTIIANPKVFANIKINHLLRLMQYIQHESVFQAYIKFPKGIQDFLTLMLSSEFMAKLKELKLQPPRKPEHINLNHKYVAGKDDIIKVMELYKKARNTSALKPYYTFTLDFGLFSQSIIKNDLNGVMTMCVFCMENNNEQDRLKLREILLQNFIYDIENENCSSFKQISIDDLVAYLDKEPTFLNELAKKLPEDKWNVFIKGIFSLANDFVSCMKVAKIFPTEPDKLRYAFIQEMKNVFIELMVKVEKPKEFNSALLVIMKLMQEKKFVFTIDELNKFESNTDLNKVEQIYGHFLLVGRACLDSESYQKILKYLIMNTEEKNISKLVNYYKVIPKNEKNFFFEAIKDMAFEEKDFYSPKITIPFLLLRTLINEKIFSAYIGNSNIEYIKKSESNLNNIRNDLQKGNFQLETAGKIKDAGNILKDRMDVLYYNEKSTKQINMNVVNLCNKVENDVDVVLSYQRCIAQRLRYEQFFCGRGDNATASNVDNSNSKPSSKIEKLVELREQINEKPIAEIMNNKSAYENELLHLQEAQEFNRYIESEFFKALFFEYSSEGSEIENPKHKAKEDTHSLKVLFESENGLNNVRPDILRIFQKRKFTLNEIKTDIDKLKELLSITTKLPAQIYDNISNNLYTLLSDDLLIHNIKTRLSLINESKLKIKKTTASDTLSTLYEQVSNGTHYDHIQTVLEQLKANNINVTHSKPHLSIFFNIGFHDDFFSFFLDHPPSKVKALYNLVDDSKSESQKLNLTSAELESVERVSETIDDFHKWIKSNKNPTDTNIINQFMKICDNDASLVKDFSTVCDSLQMIKKLFSQIKDKKKTGEFMKDIIKQILANGIANASLNVSKGQYECKVTYEGENKEKKTKTFTEVLEVRDRVLLGKNKKVDLSEIKDPRAKQRSEEKNEFIDLVDKFSNAVTLMNELLKSIDDCKQKGIPYTPNYKYALSNDKAIKEELKKLERMSKQFKSEAVRQYMKNHILTLLSGKNFIYVYDYIVKDKNLPIQHYIKYLSNGKTTQAPNIKVANPSDYYASVNEFLKTLHKTNSIINDQFYIKNYILPKKEKEIHKGISTCLISEHLFEKEVIECYINLTGALPALQVVLQCSPLTTPEEITAFYYRCVLCKSKVLFCMFRIELLKIETKQRLSELISLFSDLYAQNMGASLVIFYHNKADETIIQVDKIEEKHLLKYNKTIYHNGNDMNLYQFFPNVVCYLSDASGVGKSFMIEKEAKVNKMKYIYFPIGGEFNKTDVIERLLKLNISLKEQDNKSTVIHIDLTHSRNVNIIKELLFDILVLGIVSIDGKMCYLCKSITFNIELPFELKKYEDTFTILKLFQSKFITKKELPMLHTGDHPLSDTQIVCNYLKYLKKGNLKDNDILIQSKLQPGEKGLIIEKLPCEECQTLLYEYIQFKPTYYQLSAFINLLADQFKKVSEDPYLNTVYLGERYLLDIRVRIVDNLIKLTKYFTKGAFDDLLTQQDNIQRIDDEDNNNEDIAFESLVEPAPGISFINIDPSMVFINEDKGSLSIISQATKNSEEYKLLFELYNSGRYNTERIPLIDYKSLDPIGFLEEIKKVLDLHNPVRTSDKDKNNYYLSSLEEIAGKYVFTSDNYVKMILILLHTRANIPVIMMGETGCGKTSLIRIISAFKSNRFALKILNIHAGITDKDIIEFVVKNGFTEPKNDIAEEQQWVFLDEINTCHSMGLISEMMSKHSVHGTKINSNVVFIGACNPYRKISKEHKEANELGLVSKNQEHSRKLVYTVNPLPHSLLNYVLNFGQLQEDDEQKYIYSIIYDSIWNKLQSTTAEDDNTSSSNSKEFIDLAKKAIFEAQCHIKKSNGACAASLRDVRRFVVLFEWFFEYLVKKKNMGSCSTRFNYKYETMTADSIAMQAIMLALYLCYYIRLPQKEKRKLLVDNFNSIFVNNKSHDKFYAIITREQYYVLDNIELPKGIAKNSALLENVFALFVCINCKLPLFICGKPGCSKSYALRLLCNSMNGDDSSHPFFKMYPRVIVHSYQGSRTSTSEGVLKLFEKARNALTDSSSLQHENEEIISLIVFDEMGLAEISPHNPLKVIHAELEYDEQKEEDKVAFVGISNWKLDASKMNRGIFLSIPEPDEQDLTETAITIANTYNNLGQANSELFTGLAKTYYEYKKQLAQSNKELEDYHGARDFYHLIKETAKKLLKNPALGDIKALASTVNNALERNFGGLPNSVLHIKELCNKKLPDLGLKPTSEYKVLDCLEDSLIDNDSRYSLIIAKSALSPIIVTNILTRMKKDYVFLSGSQFEGDLLSEEYSLNVLNQITSYMNEPKVLILQHMEGLYPSLYDLFNQNFLEMDKRYYARISLGFKNNLLCQVHKQFKCIVLVDQNELSQQEAPFLNRFEKQIISLENLIEFKDKELKQLPSKINEHIERLFTLLPPTNKDIDLSKNKVNCDLGNIQELVYTAVQKKTPLTQIDRFVIDAITPSLTQDVIGCLSKTRLFMQNPDIAKTIADSYIKKHKHTNLKEYIQHKQKNKLIVFTFNSIAQRIEGFNKENAFEILISSCDTEKKFVTLFTEFVGNKKANLLFIRLRPCDCKHLNHIRYITEKSEYSKNMGNKTIVFVVHMSRFFPNYHKTKEEIIRDTLDTQHLVSLLASDYEQITIDDLYDVNQRNILSLTKCSSVELFKLINIKQFIMKHIPICFSYLDYDVLNKPQTYYDDKVISFTMKNTLLFGVFEDVLINKYIPSCTVSWASFLKQLSNYITPNSTSFYTVFENYLRSQLNFTLLKVIYASERDSIISPLLFGLQTPIANAIVNEYYNTFNLDLEYKQLQQSIGANTLQHIVGVCIPSITKIVNEVITEIKTRKEQYLDLDSKLRLEGGNDQLTQGTVINVSEILKAKQLHIDNVYAFLTKIKGISILNNDHFFMRSDNYNIAKSDYAKIFLTSNGFVHQDITKIEEFMNLFFLIIESNIEGDNLMKYSYIILTCEVYNEQIKTLCEVFKEYIPFISDLCGKIHTKIKANAIIIEDTHKNKINKPFMLIVETVLQIVREVYNSNNSIPEDKSGLFMKALKITQQVFNNLNVSLKLSSKELYFFNSFMDCVSLLNLVRKGDIVHLKKMQALSNEERKLLNEKKEDLLTQNLNEQLTYLKTECNNLTHDFSKHMIEILVSKFNQFTGTKYHETIFNYVFSINDLIIKCHPLLVQVVDPSPVIIVPPKQTINQVSSNFISFAKGNKPHIGLIKFNETKNAIAIDVLLYYFEMSIYKTLYPYHKELKNYTNGYIGLAFNYFDIAIKNIETYNTSPSNLKYQLKQIAFIYSIAYVKVYLHFMAEATVKMKVGKIDTSVFNKAIQSNKGKVIETVKVYFMKCLRAYFSTLKMFAVAPWKEYKLQWVGDYSSKINFPHVFNTALITISNVDLYYKMENEVKNVLYQGNKDTKEIETLLDTSPLSFLAFFDATTNKILSLLQSEENVNAIDYNNLSSFCELLFAKLLQDNKITSNTKSLLDLYYNKQTFKEIIFPLIKNLLNDEYEIFIYLYKLALLVSISSKDNYYSKLLSNSAKQTIDNSYNPGVDPLINARITGYYFVKSMFDSPDFKRPENFSPGVYRCDCGYVYQLIDCGFPWDIYKCSNCRKDIGGEHHNLVSRPGHVRVIINKEEEKFLHTKKYRWVQEKRYLFWKDYKAEMEKIIDKEPKGVPQNEFDIFSTEDKIVRNLDQVSYRLLNLVFFSCVYFSHLMKCISKEELKSYTCNNHTCLEMLKVSFNCLEKALYLSSINNSVMFLNTIMPTLYNHIKDVKVFDTKKHRNDFEIKVAKDINKEIKSFETNSFKKYIKENIKLLGTNKDSIEGMINEIHSPSECDKNKYPLINYFVKSSYPNSDILNEKLMQIDKKNSLYPVLSAYIGLEGIDASKLNSFLEMNPFVNEMISRYSFKISREEAKEKTINSELKKIGGDKLMKKFNTFIQHYNKLLRECNKYQCRTLEYPGQITSNSKLAYVLNDDGDNVFGMHIASIYEHFIHWQNEFIDSVLNNLNQDNPLYYLKSSLEQKILLFNSTNSKIIDTTLKGNQPLSSLDDLIWCYSYRNCYSLSNNQIIYEKYKNYNIDYNAIDIALGKYLLTNKNKFEDKQTFVIYKYEAYRSSGSSAIIEYLHKYEQRQLNETERVDLETFTKKERDVHDIMFSLQQLIFFISKQNFKSSMPITEAIKRKPAYLNIRYCICSFFEEHPSLCLNTLIEIYEQFELICVEDIILNADYVAKIEYSPQEKERIINEFKNYSSEKITLIMVEHAVRKYITRMLGGTRTDSELGEEGKVISQLARPELWPKHIRDKIDDYLDDIIYLDAIFELKLKNIVHFYRLLKEYRMNSTS